MDVQCVSSLLEYQSQLAKVSMDLSFWLQLCMQACCWLLLAVGSKALNELWVHMTPLAEVHSLFYLIGCLD